MGVYDVLKLGGKCVICTNNAGIFRTNTALGSICSSCMSKLKKNKIGVYSVADYPLAKLIKICGIDISNIEENKNIDS